MRIGGRWVLTALLFSATSCGAETTSHQAVVIPAAPANVPSAAAPPAQAKTTKFVPAADVVADDAALPADTIRVTVVDADGEPLPRAPVELETVMLRAQSSELDVMAKDTAIADEKGTVTFRKVGKAGSGTDLHFFVSTRRGDGVFSVEPFAMAPKAGKRVTLHAYETVRDLTHALVAMTSVTLLHVKADAIEIEVAYQAYNLDRVAWVPVDTHVSFPPSVTQFLASDLGLAFRVDEITALGFALVGTVAPGKHELEYHYQIPRDRKGTQQVVLDQPPRVAIARVLLEASGPAKLVVAGFPAATTERMADGTPILKAERRANPGEAMKSLDITLSGDPK